MTLNPLIVERVRETSRPEPSLHPARRWTKYARGVVYALAAFGSGVVLGLAFGEILK